MFRKLFNKFKYNNLKNNNMSTEKEPSIYVWHKSERAGKIVIENETKDGWLYFTDGSRINPKLVNEFLIEVPTMEEAEIHASTFSKPGQPVITPEKVNVVTEQKTTTKEKAPLNPNDIIIEILERLSKKNKTKFTVDLTVKVPSKTIIKALEQDVDEEELRDGLRGLIKKQINNIEEQLDREIETFIQNYYYESTTKKKRV